MSRAGRDTELIVAAVGALGLIFIGGLAGVWFFMQAASRAQLAASRQAAAAQAARLTAEAERARAEVEGARAGVLEAQSGKTRTDRTPPEDPDAAAAVLSNQIDVDPQDRDANAREVLDHAARDLDAGRLRERPAAEAALRDRLGETYLLLRDFDAAEAQFTRSLELRTLLYEASHPELAQARARLDGVKKAREAGAGDSPRPQSEGSR